jgi:hypothetical protein
LEAFQPVPNIQYVPQAGGDPIRFVDDVEDGTDADALILPSDAGRAVLRDVGQDEEGFRLVFTPTIGTDTMLCDVEALVNTVVGQNTLDEPIVGTRRTETVITLADGNAALIGAFDQRRVTEVQDGIPLLRRIPYLGRALFSETTEQIHSTKLVILVTPHIDDNLEYEDIALMWGDRVEDPDVGRSS